MKIYSKNLPLLLLLAFNLTTGCKKSEPAVQNVQAVVPPKDEIPAKLYLPTQLGTGTNKMVFTYTGDHCFKKIEYGDGSSDVFTYTSAGKPSRVQHFQGTIETYTVEFVLDKSGLLTEAYSFTYAIPDNEESAGYYKLSYTTGKEPAGISFYDNNDVVISSQQRSYSSAGNLTGRISSLPGMSRDYSYDDKNGLFKNVSYNWLPGIENRDNLFLFCSNNLTVAKNTASASNEQTFSCTYNANLYPETIVSLTGSTSVSRKVTYTAID